MSAGALRDEARFRDVRALLVVSSHGGLLIRLLRHQGALEDRD